MPHEIFLLLWQGEKWSSTKWIHVASLRDGAAADAALLTGCHDADKGCEDWAWNDECAWKHLTCFLPSHLQLHDLPAAALCASRSC